MADSAAQRELMLENSQRQFKLFEQRLVERMEQETAEDKSQEKRLASSVETKSASVSTDLGKEINAREEDMEMLKATLEV